MYVSPWMQAALLPRRFDVCGFILPPLSLWHVYILRTSGNAYVCNTLPDKDAAAELILYCMRGVAGARELFVNQSLRESESRAIYRKLAPMEMTDIDACVREYVAACSRVPAHNQTANGTGKPVKVPYEWALVEYICKGDARRIDDAFDTPYSIAACLIDAQRNVAGIDDTLITETDEKRIDEKLERWATEGAA